MSIEDRPPIEKLKFAGAIDITGDLAQPSSVIWLDGVDLEVSNARATRDGTTMQLDATHVRVDGRIGLLSETPLGVGRWTISIEYSGSVHDVDAPVMREWGERSEPAALGLFRRVVHDDSYFFTNSEPIYARWIFPCIDEPDRKVPWQLTLDVPNRLVALANAPVVHETAIDNQRKRVEFAPTPPLPSYLIAFAIGPFDLVDAGKAKSGIPIRIAMPHGEAAAGAWAAETTPRILNVLEDWFQITLPYSKLDIVAVPHLGLAAMENPGLVTFSEEGFKEKESWVAIASHELAHQWFGDLVSPKWWDDIWLNENFAAWMAGKVSIETGSVSDEGAIEQGPWMWRWLAERKPLRQPFADIGALEEQSFERKIDRFGGGVVVSLFEEYVGREKFRLVIHDYLTEHANGNATSEDFFAAVGKVAGSDTETTLKAFIENGGLPRIELSLKCELGRSSLDVGFEPIESEPGSEWTVPLCFAYDRDAKRIDSCVTVNRSQQIPLEGKSCPTWIAPIVHGLAPYRIKWSEAKLTALLARGWSLLSANEQRGLFVTGAAAPSWHRAG